MRSPGAPQEHDTPVALRKALTGVSFFKCLSLVGRVFRSSVVCGGGAVRVGGARQWRGDLPAPAPPADGKSPATR